MENIESVSGCGVMGQAVRSQSLLIAAAQLICDYQRLVSDLAVGNLARYAAPCNDQAEQVLHAITTAFHANGPFIADVMREEMMRQAKQAERN